ncbi:MAG: hypothetical protein IJL88_02225 [Clostridia bacterium]|nr:hypothetical protein [Clostridia bacterium]
MFTTYDPSLHVTLTCNDQQYLAALHLFESVCAPSIFPYVHQLDRDTIGQMQQKWFARCLQEILALSGDTHFFPVPMNSWIQMAEKSIEQEAQDLYRKFRPQFSNADYSYARSIA